MQIDPNIPANIPEQDLGNVEPFLDTVLKGVTGDVTPEILEIGMNLGFGLAVVLVVWTGLKIAFSGGFDMWVVVQLINRECFCLILW